MPDDLKKVIDYCIYYTELYFFSIKHFGLTT